MKYQFPTLAVMLFGIALVYTLATEESRIEKRLIGVTAQCHDGKYTATPRNRGACSSHGGVKRWISQ